MKEVFSKFLKIFKQLSTYLTIIVFFVYTAVLDRDLECTCKNQSRHCNLYMALPFLISFVLHLWVDKRFQGIWRFTSTTCCCTCSENCTERCESNCKFIWILIYEILKAAFIGLLWVIFVLLDGDWYVCCQNDGSEQQAQLACKKDKATPEEKANIAELKNKSKIIGLSMLLCTLLAFAFFSSFGWRKCCESRGCCNRKIFYDELILEEEENVLQEVLRKAAKDKLTKEIEKNINGKHWKECLHVAEKLIKDNTTARLAKQNEGTELKELQSSEQQEEGSDPP